MIVTRGQSGLCSAASLCSAQGSPLDICGDPLPPMVAMQGEQHNR